MYIAAFFIFLHPNIYPKVSIESVIRIPDPLLLRLFYNLMWRFEYK